MTVFLWNVKSSDGLKFESEIDEDISSFCGL